MDENEIWQSKPVIRDVILNPLILILVFATSGLGLVVIGWIYLRRSTTKYTLTSQRVVLESGIFAKSVDDIELYRIRDTRVHQNTYDRLFGIGSVEIRSVDGTGNIKLAKIAKPRDVRESVRTAVELVKQSRNIRIMTE